MLFTYAPEGAEPQVWDFSPDKIMSPEAEAIERQTGLTFVEWQQKLLTGSIMAAHGLLWVLLKRDNPQLKYDQVVFATGETSLDFSAEERAELISDLEKHDQLEGLEPEQRALLEQLRAEAADAGDPEPVPLEERDGSADAGLVLVPKDSQLVADEL